MPRIFLLLLWWMRQIGLTSSFTRTFVVKSLGAFQRRNFVRCPRSTTRGVDNDKKMPGLFEVEQKFPIPSDVSEIERRLQNAGFSRSALIEMVDWYFDDVRFALSCQDCWLRFREAKGKGQWQLKRGQSNKDEKTTVYEEIEGPEAYRISCDLLSKTKDEEQASLMESTDFGQDHPPPLPDETNDDLRPFARIATRRSSWSNGRLTVDLDATDFGHAVGEVEAVVASKEEIAQAQQDIRKFLRELVGDAYVSKGGPAQGKLEFYLESNQPKLLEKLRECGVM